MAPLRHADCVEQCPSSRAKRKTYARTEFFSIWTQSGRARQLPQFSAWWREICLHWASSARALPDSGPRRGRERGRDVHFPKRWTHEPHSHHWCRPTRAALCRSGINKTGRDDNELVTGTSDIGTFETCRRTLKRSAYGGRLEVVCARSNRRFGAWSAHYRCNDYFRD